jgi:hypothetical protein
MTRQNCTAFPLHRAGGAEPCGRTEDAASLLFLEWGLPPKRAEGSDELRSLEGLGELKHLLEFEGAQPVAD